jgi:hypothetical protein
MPFQVVELRLDAEDQVIDRRAIPYPYPGASTRLTLSKSSSRGWKRLITPALALLTSCERLVDLMCNRGRRLFGNVRIDQSKNES